MFFPAWPTTVASPLNFFPPTFFPLWKYSLILCSLIRGSGLASVSPALMFYLSFSPAPLQNFPLASLAEIWIVIIPSLGVLTTQHLSPRMLFSFHLFGSAFNRSSFPDRRGRGLLSQSSLPSGIFLISGTQNGPYFVSPQPKKITPFPAARDCHRSLVPTRSRPLHPPFSPPEEILFVKSGLPSPASSQHRPTPPLSLRALPLFFLMNKPFPTTPFFSRNANVGFVSP